MSEANSRQVGGSHYKTANGIEHWDLVHMFQLDYFQGQITKYVMRWKDKGGTQDLEKARHFLDKYIELSKADPSWGLQNVPQEAGKFPATELPEFAQATAVISNTTKQFQNQDGNEYWQNEGYYGDGTCLYTCRKCKHQERTYLAPVHPHGCGNQGALEPSDAAA